MTGVADGMDSAEVARLFARLTGWGVPPQETVLLLNRLKETVALGFVKQWVIDAHKPEGPTMLVMAGPKGVGKTIAAAYAMFYSEPPLPYGGKWKTEQAPRFRHVADIAEMGLYGSDEVKKQRGELKHTRALVVDDLGAEVASEHFLALFDSIVDARYGSMGHTIFTTNLTVEQFSRRYGDRVYDRIRGRGDWFDVDHESLRGRG